MQTATRESILETISLLPNKKMELLGNYLNFLLWEDKQPKFKDKSMAQKLIETVGQSNQVTMEDAQALLNAIEDGKKTMRFDSPKRIRIAFRRLDKIGDLKLDKFSCRDKACLVSTLLHQLIT